MNEFIRTELLLGRAAVDRLQKCRVAVFGVGGVGGHCAEALARSGVGTLDLIDADVFTESNLNRQLFATRGTVGVSKVEAAKARLLSIFPEMTVHTHEVFVLPESIGAFDFTLYDYVVDAIDTVTGKLAIIEAAKAANTPVISAMGAGNKLDPTAFRVTDIMKTRGCPLARAMRTELRRRGIENVKVVFSEEAPHPLDGDALRAVTDAEGDGKRTPPGSLAFVPSVAGLIAASEVVKDLTGVR